MVRAFLFLSTLMLVLNTQAQDEAPYRYENTLKATATITPGIMLNQKQTDIYLNGELEYFTDSKISVRGDVFWMVGAQQKPSLLKDNSAIFFGGLYHFHKNRFDYFIGFQPGVSFTKPNATNDVYSTPQAGIMVKVTTEYDYKLIPNFSPVTGITFYASNYFNFFLNVRYVYARYYGYEGSSINLDEFRISGGLGFQIHTTKKK